MEHPKPQDVVDEMGIGAEPSVAGEPLDAEESVEPDELDDAAETGSVAEGRGLTEMLRKVMVAGLGAVFMTEEGIRTYVKDLKLPKELMGFVVGQAERSKDELFRVLSEELRRFFQNPALRRELAQLISEMTVEIHADIRLKPQDQGEPQVRVHRATTRRNKKRE